jgi:hypothetical protein
MTKSWAQIQSGCEKGQPQTNSTDHVVVVAAGLLATGAAGGYRAAPAMPATAPRACAPISRSLLVECLSTNQNACSLLHFVTQSQKLTSLSPRNKR